MGAKLIDKTYKTYDYISRYASFPYYYNETDQKYMYGITEQLSQDTVYTIYEVKIGDSYDSIALDLYQSPLYYWIICDFNHIKDPCINPTVGTKLKIPSLSAISFKQR